MSLIQPFDSTAEPKLDDLGGKGASLVTMTQAGMPVPPGFVVTTESFDAFLSESGIADEIASELARLNPDDVAEVDEISARIRGRLTDAAVPEAVRTATKVAFDDLVTTCGGEVPMAVRSSATAEDLPDASFAGQQDTYLWLNGYAAVTEHIRRCWASLYTSRAIIYRLKNNIPDEGLSMAVVVQKMVNAKTAGVAITMNPANGDRSKIAIDASWGVGETVVSGLVTPDNILMDKITLQVVSEHIGEKHIELVPADGELTERDVPADRAEIRCLSDEEMAAVAGLAKRAEKHYKCPQDIEWALDRDLPDGENLLLLQSRPETVHSSAEKKTEKDPAAAAKPAAPAAASTGGIDLGSITASLMKKSG
ncbi:PEP/pyruvate-binding domain-containing protein [Brevibacterium spongiae]|uniref:Phosphoenolpyruvate synthase n=1 Tax=Brevibacterium spongiae TaxID=2909672 RepID=A0ABY5SXA8_9MICO|nr:PEP/pyruvate-binding domain-containing protein [Brevibacterium spongiae]UVI37339.1 PEP/pyruvate-binding domain-containing protein [Brevibacterium spongiae]